MLKNRCRIIDVKKQFECCAFFLFQDKVHIPGAIFLSVKFDSRCYTEEGCDEVIMSSSADFLQDVHNFSGSPQKWADFEIPGEEQVQFFLMYFLSCSSDIFFSVWVYHCVFLSGDTLHYRFMSDMSNTEWGYKFTVTGGHRGRFQTGNSPHQRKVPRQMVWLDQKLLLLMIMPSFLPRLWDTKANVGRWTTAWPLASGWHLGVAGGRGLSPDRKPAPQSHSLVAPPHAVPVPDVRAQHCSPLLFLWLFPRSLFFNWMVVYCDVKAPEVTPIIDAASSLLARSW